MWKNTHIVPEFRSWSIGVQASNCSTSNLYRYGDVEECSKITDENHKVYMSPALKGLEMVPPTSNVIYVHLFRGFFVLWNALTRISSTINECEPEKFGWESHSQLLPTKFPGTLTDDKVVTCQCTNKCETKHCPCKAASVSCVTYWHTGSWVWKQSGMCIQWWQRFVIGCLYVITDNKIIVPNCFWLKQ